MRFLLALLFAAPIVGPLAVGVLAAERASDAMHRAVPSGASTWDGNYTCAQGLTHLSLTMQRAPGTNAIDALFVFDADDRNPGVPSGSFTMHGVVDGAHLSLQPGSWIARPPRYETVGLSGDVDERFTGRVAAGSLPGCTTFELARAERAPSPIPSGTSHWIGSDAAYDFLDIAAHSIDVTIERSDALPELLTGTLTIRPAATPSSAPTTIKLAGHFDRGTNDVVLAPVAFITQGRGAKLLGLHAFFDGEGRMHAALLDDVTRAGVDAQIVLEQAR